MIGGLNGPYWTTPPARGLPVRNNNQPEQPAYEPLAGAVTPPPIPELTEPPPVIPKSAPASHHTVADPRQLFVPRTPSPVRWDKFEYSPCNPV